MLPCRLAVVVAVPPAAVVAAPVVAGAAVVVLLLPELSLPHAAATVPIEHGYNERADAL